MRRLICGIYKIFSTIDSRFYIGSSKNIESRRYDHFHDLKHNKHENEVLQRFYNKYGKDSLSFEIVEECQEYDLIERENFYILSSNVDLLFNMKLVEEGRCVHSEERKKLMSDKKKAYFLSEESKVTRQKLSDKTRERYTTMTQEERTKSTEHTRTEESIRKRKETQSLTMKNRTTEQIEAWKEKAREMGKISGLKKTQLKAERHSKTILQLDRVTKTVIKEYQGVESVKIDFKLDIYLLLKACKSGEKYKKFCWKFKEENTL